MNSKDRNLILEHYQELRLLIDQEIDERKLEICAIIERRVIDGNYDLTRGRIIGLLDASIVIKKEMDRLREEE